jgi:predicted metalloendopeptidase
MLLCLFHGNTVSAARVLNGIDTSVNPCDNFYTFACGSWIKSNVIPEHKGSVSVFAEVREKVAVIVKGNIPTIFMFES